MKLYETSTPGEYLGLQFDVMELLRFLQAVAAWRKKARPKGLLILDLERYDAHQNDINSTVLLENAFAPIAKAIDDGQIEAVKAARVWGSFRAELYKPIANAPRVEYGTTLTGYPLDYNDQPIKDNNENDCIKIIFSRPLAECLTVYRVHSCAEWGALDVGAVDMTHGILSPTLPPTDDATIKALLAGMRAPDRIFRAFTNS